MNRITGQETEVRLIIDGKVVDTLRDITVEFPTMPEDYIGETKPHPLGDLGKYEVTLTMDPADEPAWKAFAARLAAHGRAEYLRALAEHILAGHWFGQIQEANGAWWFCQIMRLRPVVDDPASSAYQNLGCTFDNQADPKRGTWTGRPFPTPTLDDLIGQLERSERPWMAMEAGPAGFINTICAPKGGTTAAPLPVWWFLDCGPGPVPGTRSLEPLIRILGEHHPCDENGGAP